MNRVLLRLVLCLGICLEGCYEHGKPTIVVEGTGPVEIDSLEPVNVYMVGSDGNQHLCSEYSGPIYIYKCTPDKGEK
jgi:hypothetical protein